MCRGKKREEENYAGLLGACSLAALLTHSKSSSICIFIPTGSISYGVHVLYHTRRCLCEIHHGVRAR